MLDFDKLDALKAYLTEIGARHAPSLLLYYDADKGTFYHRYDVRDPGKVSEASSATCVLSLIAAKKWDAGPWSKNAKSMAMALLQADWKSAELEKGNVFTTSFVLEAVTALSELDSSIGSDTAASTRIAEAVSVVKKGIEDGYASVFDYPPSAYLTQLAVRTLKHRNELDAEVGKKVTDWALAQIDHQLALLVARSSTSDLLQLGYSVILVTSLTESAKLTPDRNLILQTAIKELFTRQRDDGTWPRSQPLFHYPKVGNAYCYEYEMLAQLLQEPGLEDQLLEYLPQLSLAAHCLRGTEYRLPDGGLGWSSDHHPQFEGPESWSTASVYHFIHVLGRLLAEGIRKSIFRHVGSTYNPPRSPGPDVKEFAPDFLDCELRVDGEPRSLRETIRDHFVEPLAREAPHVAGGIPLPEETPMSAVFFGPPGTSKTMLSRQIARYIGWPHLSVDPSHFVRTGLDHVQAEADKLFSRLVAAERILVLLDEFDEMFRARSSADEILSRFLTTGMLPKLATINRERRIVFIVATNHIEHFDLAISRHGRLDMIVQVMPPTFEEKLRGWPDAAKKIAEYGLGSHKDTREKLGDLTFGEFKALASALVAAGTCDDARRAIDDAHRRSTMMSRPDPANKKTWKQACSEQQDKIRVPPRT